MKRWIIRSFFIGLLLLFVGGWVGSYRYSWLIAHQNQDLVSIPGYEYVSVLGVRCNWGKIQLTYWHADPASQPNLYPTFFEGDGWLVHAESSHPLLDSAFVGQFNSDYFLGFFIELNHPDYPAFYSLQGNYAAIPFWFPTTISAAFLLLVWRKTRPNVKGRAFPVELAKPKGES